MSYQSINSIDNDDVRYITTKNTTIRLNDKHYEITHQKQYIKTYDKYISYMLLVFLIVICFVIYILSLSVPHRVANISLYQTSFHSIEVSSGYLLFLFSLISYISHLSYL